MRVFLPVRLAILVTTVVTGTATLLTHAYAKDLKITLPKDSPLTPVQRLNREGVDEIRKHRYDKAETLFYKAYLFDSSDPFTLFNLGYISELQGNIERAQVFYKSASEQATDAVIDRTNVRSLEGRPMTQATQTLQDLPMRVNRGNIEAMRLLSAGRPSEAELLLNQTLALDPNNAFTLNNLGVAKESQGELDEAAKFYSQAAQAHTSEVVVVASNQTWRGKSVNEMAAQSQLAVEEQMRKHSAPEDRAAQLNFRGVAAMNRNDPDSARKDFTDAYKLDPNSAFSLNNAGYLAEMNGDTETANFFYDRAKLALDASRRVGLATKSAAEGRPVSDTANTSGLQTSTELDRVQELRRRQHPPIQLKTRDGQPVTSNPPAATTPPPSTGVPTNYIPGDQKQ
jgi:Flp pilus assembly protein TadD